MQQSQSQTQTYLLTAATEIERLRLQARVFEPGAERLFDAIPVRAGWRCLDIACGAMGCVVPLARRAGPTGRVLGTDVEPKMVEATLAYLAEQHLPSDSAPVEVIQDDAYASRLPDAAFDLTHVRFLLAPVGRDAELITQLLRVTRPGGIVAAQEPHSGSWSVWPPSPAFNRLQGAILEAFRAGGGDFDAGRRLYELWTNAGLRDVQIRAEVFALPQGHPYLRVPIQFANSLRPRLLAEGIFTEAELDATITELEAHLARPDATGLTYTVVQAWGTKPE